MSMISIVKAFMSPFHHFLSSFGLAVGFWLVVSSGLVDSHSSRVRKICLEAFDILGLIGGNRQEYLMVIL